MIAALSIRKTASFIAFFSRIAVFRSSSTRWARLTKENYDVELRLSILADAKPFGARCHRTDVARRNNLGIFACSFQQTCEHAARSELDKQIAAESSETLDAIDPSHRA